MTLPKKLWIFLYPPDAPIEGWLNRMTAVESVDVLHSPIMPEASLPLADIAKADVVILWSPLGQWRSLTQDINRLLPRHALLLVDTHTTLATTVAATLSNPQQVIGFSPLGTYCNSTLVTLAAPLQGTLHARQQADCFWTALGLEPVWIADTPGMVLPRIYAMLVNEATFALQEGVASPEDLDTAMKLGTNYPKGPLAWAEMVGLDTVLAILDHLWQTYRDERYRPCLLLQQYVQAGYTSIHAGHPIYSLGSSK
jgi:3-hydroxybutyryl-CoA dehydrogenase